MPDWSWLSILIFNELSYLRAYVAEELWLGRMAALVPSLSRIFFVCLVDTDTLSLVAHNGDISASRHYNAILRCDMIDKL
ncbi:hypothetical protein N7533_000428 [Penicillium manginii]|uniref:uncharacterized protein n=1 Tax=Penicillium manginii TaxID=203109 RepID=UPI0025488C14|nr:uncharacterized protein N7533_000428 [Penicillium manginii]KAJ5767845.1 hypothetical protein N7533_000428 [Penicillium manginii]